MEERKVVYSTKTGYSKGVLEEASTLYKNELRNAAKEEISPIIESLATKDDRAILHISVFKRYWYPKIKAFIEEGRDLISEENPQNSIFAAWSLAAGSCFKGIRVVERSNANPDAFVLIVETPGIVVPKRFNPNVINMNLEAIGSDMARYVNDGVRFTEKTKSVANEIHSFIKNDDSTEDAVNDREELKKRWMETLNTIDQFFNHGNSKSESQSSRTESSSSKQKETVDDSMLDF